MQQVDRPGCCASGGDLHGGRPAVQEAVVRNVAEGVDVAVPLVVVIDADVVLGEAHAPGSDVDVGQHRHLVMRRLGVVDAPLRVERPAERNRHPEANQPGGGGDPVGGEVVEGPHLRPLAPATPVGDLPEELVELAGAEIDAPVSLPTLTRRHQDLVTLG